MKGSGQSRHPSGSYSVLPDVAAHFHIQFKICGAAVAAPRASRAGLPLRGSGPDNVWQLVVCICMRGAIQLELTRSKIAARTVSRAFQAFLTRLDPRPFAHPARSPEVAEKLHCNCK